MENVVSNLIGDVEIPRMFKVRQLFDDAHIAPEEIPGLMERSLEQEQFASRIKPGMRIAITCGSRQIANLVAITKSIVSFVRKKGGSPFVVASMGSHGGATSEGQRKILRALGVTEESVGCPIETDMDVVKIGCSDDGRDVFIDRRAAEADGIIVSCRIKPHTNFRGAYESGIMKMMAIGLGKQVGAGQCHADGYGRMAENIPRFGRTILANANILFAVAAIENAYDETAEIAVLDRDEIEEEEPKLLERAKALIPKILVPECDVLIVDQIGKNFSGSGMDPNITGTFLTPYASGGIKNKRVAVLDMSDESCHSGVGIGMAHATTRRFFEKMDFAQTYPNLITTKMIENARIPVIMENDREAIQVCIKTLTDADRNHLRVVRIPNSLNIRKIWLSEAYYEEAKANKALALESEPEEMTFDDSGNLTDLGYVR